MGGTVIKGLKANDNHRQFDFNDIYIVILIMSSINFRQNNGFFFLNKHLESSSTFIDNVGVPNKETKYIFYLKCHFLKCHALNNFSF